MNQYAIEIPVRPSVFLIQNTAPIDPAQFAALLAEHGQEFDYHDNVSMEIPRTTADEAIDRTLIKALNIISSTTRLQVVEVVPGAASLYGKSVQGPQVAGLLKYELSADDDERKAATMTIDLKSTDDGFLEALVEQLSCLDFSQ